MRISPSFQVHSRFQPDQVSTRGSSITQVPLFSVLPLFSVSGALSTSDQVLLSGGIDSPVFDTTVSPVLVELSVTTVSITVSGTSSITGVVELLVLAPVTSRAIQLNPSGDSVVEDISISNPFRVRFFRVQSL